MRKLLLLTLVVAGGVGCGGDAAPPPQVPKVAAPKPAVKVEPQVAIDVQVRGHRQGSALHVDVIAVAKNSLPGSEFEKPELWDITAEIGGTGLRRVLNGSRQVERIPAGEFDEDRWDVNLQFSTAFAIPEEAVAAQVWVTPPSRTAERFILEGLAIPKGEAQVQRSKRVVRLSKR